MIIKSIEDEFRDYFAMCFPKGSPGKVQEDETKQAFFAGAWAMWCATAEMGMDHISEDEAVEYLEARRSEMEAFQKQLMARYLESN